MKILVACSSKDNISNLYMDECMNLLSEILKENDLVFGAYNGGLMGLSHLVALYNDRKITGICPIKYKEDFKSILCDYEIVTNTVLERTDKLIEESDILLFLPGGIGTVFELLSSIESMKCHEHNKPIIIYNLNNFYDKLINFIADLYNTGFTIDINTLNILITDKKEEIDEYSSNNQKVKRLNLKNKRLKD